MKYKVVYMQQAKEDLRAIYEYIAFTLLSILKMFGRIR